jgi:hypothetical protein
MLTRRQYRRVTLVQAAASGTRRESVTGYASIDLPSVEFYGLGHGQFAIDDRERQSIFDQVERVAP